MKSLFKKIDYFLLPRSQSSASMHYAPYIWLVYLGIFFMSLIAYHPIEYSYVYATIGLFAFLIVYFNGYWASTEQIKWNIFGILLIGSLLAILTLGASVFFVYASAFCCRLSTPKKAFVGLIVIVVWIGVYSWFYSLSSFFYVPAILFSVMIGGINIYQHNIDLKRQELILSQQEVKHLAKISERERIARDLHDLIGHTFSVITLKAELAGKLIDKEKDKSKSEIKQIENISREALKQIREVVTGYRTSDLNSELAHAKYVLQSNDINFEYCFDKVEFDDVTNKELAIILKELVTNILKHSQASKVECKISQINNEIILTLEDNGNGFDANAKVNGFGLKGIKERIDKLNGQISIVNEQGSKFIISIPALKSADN